jgi:hypothetical protein
MASGDLPSVTIGRSRRVPVSALRSFVVRLGDKASNDRRRWWCCGTASGSTPSLVSMASSPYSCAANLPPAEELASAQCSPVVTRGPPERRLLRCLNVPDIGGVAYRSSPERHH